MKNLREVKDDLLKEWIEFKNFMDYLYYWNEKYYRNGFVDVIELLYL